MKPIELKFQAFQSYYKETTIDFTGLSTDGVYLILGNTGSGKTTIFDAMCYALFGSPSSSVRDEESIKNKNADHHQDCFVEFTFEEKGKKYKVRRSPRQQSVSKRTSNGMKLEEKKASLEYLSEPNNARESSNVTATIEKIIGLNREQFLQVCMLAQGNFSKILTSNTQDRTLIFRSIFQTEKYDRFSKILSRKFQDASNTIKQTRSTLDAIYNETHYCLTEEEESKNSETSDEFRLRHMEEGLKSYSKEEAQSKNEQAKCDALLISLEKEMTKAQLHSKDVKELDSQNKEREDLTQQVDLARQRVEDLNRKKPTIEKEHDEAVKLKGMLPEYQALDDLKKAKDQEEKSYALFVGELDRSEKMAKELSDKLQKSEARRNEIERELDKEVDLTSEIKDSENTLSQILSLRKGIAELKNIREEFLCQQRNYKKEENEYLSAKTQEEKMEDAYFHSLAGIISAEELKENEPCPVCGSLSHPHPAVLTSDDVSKEQLEKARKKTENQEKKKNEALNLFAEKTTLFKGKEEAIQKDLSAFAYHETEKTPDERIEEKAEFAAGLEKHAKEHLDELRSLKEEYENLHAERSDLTSKMDSWKKEKEGYGNAIVDFKSKASAGETKLGELKNQILQKEAKLDFPSKNEAEKRIRDLESSELNYNRDLEKAEKDLNDETSRINQLSGSIKLLEEKIQAYQGRKEEEIRSEIQTQEEKKKEISQNFSRIISGKTSLENSQKKYSDTLERNVKETENYNRLKKLALSVSAKSGGREDEKKRWISLETYVLSYYLDEVLVLASQRMERMSNGEFTLLRRTDGVIKGNGQGGLDIDVRDNNSGQIRHASSLSGGETFMASLSLALGLSDYVRASIGSKKIETLYVDEGFGTLDKESLERVVRVLAELAFNESTTIGLISHVEELKNYIPHSIQVEKDRFGQSALRVN